MPDRPAPVLHRDDPVRAPLGGHVKVTREDWLNRARDVLVKSGVAEVKILALSEALGVSRSSFYWYFKNWDDLLMALLEEWSARNTSRLVAECSRPAGNITAAVCTFFQCFFDPRIFDRGLDFAVREWSRRDPHLRERVDDADRHRLDAVRAMFERFDYDPSEADARARILYFMQLGYHALDVREPIETRMSRLRPYLLGFTGRPPDEAAVAAFLRDIEELGPQ